MFIDQLNKILARAEKAEKAVKEAQQKYAVAAEIASRAQVFQHLENGAYIDTVHGKGTVLNMVRDEYDTKARVFLGSGETATIKVISFKEFKGNVTP